jgi:murein L,D-transpeptidase YcbB/YkuD
MTRLGTNPIVTNLRKSFAIASSPSLKGEFAMPGIRLDRFLASTAVVLLLSGAVGGALAEPKSGSSMDAAAPSPAATTVTRPAGETDQPSARPAEPSGEPAASPAQATKPEASTDRTVVAIAKPDDSNDQPAAAASAARPEESTDPQPAVTAPAPTATPSQPTEAPAAVAAPSQPAEQPAAAEVPAANPQPATATGGDEVPPPAAAAPATPPASAVVDANAAITDQLRDLASGKFDRILGGKKDRAAFEAFYSARSYAPLWITDGKPNARAKDAVAYLDQADADGLDPADYPVPSLSSLTDPAALAEAEMRLSASVVTYAHHAQVGRVHWSRVSGDILYEQNVPAPAEVLANMADAADAGKALASYEPKSPGYLALKAKLAELRGGKETGKAPFPSGPMLKIGMQDERVPQLRERLGLSGDGTTYDKALADAVKKFQQEHELKATSTLTPQTVEALNGRQPDRPIDTVIANMERWRWMPHDLGKNYVIVNLPDFTLRVVENGHQVWMTKIVDGKPNMPTPIMSAEMKFITINPTWNVPPSIVAKEYMPALQQDPAVLERMGLKVSTNPDGTVHISQPPGEQNALGRVRFNFPNKFLVYQHDTPNKNLFALDKRAFSHGCMRVQDPVKYAEVLLSIVRPGEDYTQDRIRKMFGQNETDIQFPKFLPVHLTYQTAFVDEEGRLEFREDVYGRDKALLAILKGDERKVADIPIDRRENPVRREALAMPDQQSFFGGRSYYPRGGNFFTHIFGLGGDPAPAPRRRAAQRRQEIQ